MTLPSEIRLVSVNEGIATFVSDDEFEVKVTLIRAPSEVVEKLSILEKQLKNSETETTAEKEIKVKKEESPMEEFEVPSVYLDIPDSRFEKMEHVDERWWWSVTELEFFPRMNFLIHVPCSCQLLLCVYRES